MYVDNIRVEFDDEATIMDVCRKAGVEMPNFCFHSDLSVYGACRMCMVEDLDTGKIDAACTTKPKNGMRIRTNTSRLLKYRSACLFVRIVHYIPVLLFLLQDVAVPIPVVVFQRHALTEGIF